MLDNYALLSGQLNSLKQMLRGDKMPLLRNYVLFPILLSQDPDPHLEVCSSSDSPDQQKLVLFDCIVLNYHHW